ncbi:hypothetical protein GOBAR_AA08553 [Gossypium barbadense]|uniref:RNase H type-1 domain-containing protein n=1 Tax=Gossypium barbadense TaxID=3634 RepID=A0A2P5Y918_GOSBA|nr:hypothetical protein GOBAR_AA08553 [Gossypium barbadense]
MGRQHNCLDDLDKKVTDIMGKLAVPSKISIFSWRMFHNLLPTRFNLHTRGINLDPMLMCWRVWGIRNSFYQTGTAPDISSVPNWRTEYIDRLKSANQLQYTGFEQRLLAAKWKKPPHGFFKLNVDARRGSCSNKMGFGAVLRDANGSFIAARSWKQAGQADKLLMEANVVLLGIKWLLEMQDQKSTSISPCKVSYNWQWKLFDLVATSSSLY